MEFTLLIIHLKSCLFNLQVLSLGGEKKSVALYWQNFYMHNFVLKVYKSIKDYFNEIFIIVKVLMFYLILNRHGFLFHFVYQN